MKHLRHWSLAKRSSVCVLLALFSSACSTAVDNNWEQYRSSVIRLVVEGSDGESSGTAFSINDKGYYVTNHHVIEPSERRGDLVAMESLTPALKVHPATTVWSDPDMDLAVVHVPSWITPALKIYPKDDVTVNLPVLSIGYPGSSDSVSDEYNAAFTVPTVKRGIISETVKIETLGIYEHSADVNSGNSGGPLVDECGRVIGVNVAKALSSFNLVEALVLAETMGVEDTPVNIQEGAFFAVKAPDLIAGLKEQSIEFSTSGLPCLGERLKTNHLLAVLFIVIAVFAAVILLLFLYFRKKMPQQKVSLKAVSQMIVAPFVKEKPEVLEPPDGAKVYRGDGGEIIHVGVVRLQCVAGNGPPISMSPGQSLTIGRDPNTCDIAVLHESISRSHAKLVLDKDSALRVVDLKSTSGTYVDGDKVPDEPPGLTLDVNQRLIIGSEDTVYMMEMRP